MPATLNTNALCSLSDVKESLGIVSSDTTKDNIIIRKINQASQQISNYCERIFQAADYVEQYNGSNIDQLVLNQRPLNSVTKLEYRGTTLNQDNWYTLDNSYFHTDSTAGILKLLFAAEGRWDKWRVTYNAGYSTIPSDLAEACVLLACYYYQNKDGLIQIMEKQEGQRRIKYYPGIQSFNELMQQLGIGQVIDGYANWPLKVE
ncbi:MAG: phage gp6-like head-tail connector protein [Nitrospirae bacterium]|nr:MAG: phage gp6-like head-tail connector protein [Nitrospirota bacterium]